MGLDYYRDYCIETIESLLNKMDSIGFINQDVKLVGDYISLGKISKINGHLNIKNDNLSDLGELVFVKSDVWLHSENSKLNSLFKLEEVGGDLLINGSNISDLGNLKKVKGKVNLRDTKVSDLNQLSYVGGDLYLPKRLEGLNLDGIQIKGKVRYWNDKKTSKIQNLNNELQRYSELNFSNIHKGELNQKQKVLNGKFLVNKCFKISEYNNYIIDNYNDFIKFVDSELDILYGQGYSFYEMLYGEIKSTKEINDEFPDVKIDKRYNNFNLKIQKLSNSIILNERKNYPFTKYIKKLNHFKKDKNWNNGISSYWLRYDEHKLGFSSYTGLDKDSFIYYVENKLLETFSVFIDSLQNKYRVSKGLPKIGEGWISETELFYKIKEYFSDIEVKHHGKTKWLGKQHIDIWIPKYRIGIEYQGEQHQRPIDFFGGEDGFIKNKERDERKKKLFELNNSHLIEVFPNYVFDDIVFQIEKIIKS
jgi:hypothetical protein